MDPVRRHPFLSGALAATALFALITAPVDFTFMADDWTRLAAVYSSDDVFPHHFVLSLNRVPVWAVVARLLFGSHILEHTFAPMLLFFLLHALGIGLVAQWLWKHLPHPATEAAPPHTGVVVAAVVVACLHPNTYEILYWPTCMPYALGALLLGAAVNASRPWVRASLLVLSFLTYETFVLPALAILVAPTLLDRTAWWLDRQTLLRRALPAVGVWGAALGMTIAYRAVAAISLGAYDHQTVLTIRHVVRHALLAWEQLFHISFFGAGTNLLSTVIQYGLLLASIVFLWRRARVVALGLPALCFLSTGVYWVLKYNAMRSIYGAQILFAATVVWLVLSTAQHLGSNRIVIAALVLLLSGYLSQSFAIY
ncbi:MAG: hypothetical protein V3T05_03905, partial [Myxococcota bacterium]